MGRQGDEVGLHVVWGGGGIVDWGGGNEARSLAPHIVVGEGECKT